MPKEDSQLMSFNVVDSKVQVTDKWTLNNSQHDSPREALFHQQQTDLDELLNFDFTKRFETSRGAGAATQKQKSIFANQFLLPGEVSRPSSRNDYSDFHSPLLKELSMNNAPTGSDIVKAGGRRLM